MAGRAELTIEKVMAASLRLYLNQAPCICLDVCAAD